MVSRFKVFVTSFSLVVIVLFAVFWYLMSNIDPASSEEQPVPPAPSSVGLKSGNDISYGLERHSGNESALRLLSAETASVLDFYRTLKLQGAFVEDPLVVDVSPPNYSPPTYTPPVYSTLNSALRSSNLSVSV